MSFQAKNFYALLGNDVESEQEFVTPKEIVAPVKGTKKDGVPPKADKSKAKNGKSKDSGNEAGAKFQNKNRDSAAPRSTPRKGGKDKRGDRQSKSGRTETAKSENQKLGDEAESQLEGAADAEVESEGSPVPEEPKQKLVSAEDYFKQLESTQKPKEATPAAEIDESKLIIKETSVLFEGTGGKKVKQKAKKEKKLLDFSVQIVDNVESKRDSKPNGRKPVGKKGGKKPAAKKTLSEAKFPSLN
ncbi:Stm1 protein [Martiniozyma asiatica (nom. inval.)]|nr:Stm1 protein [Martiniozyma asiatica]